jgi:hypothetical protein
MMPDWVLPSTIAALATVLWWLGRQLVAKLDNVRDKLGHLDAYMKNELRAMDVRLSVLETLVLPRDR